MVLSITSNASRLGCIECSLKDNHRSCSLDVMELLKWYPGGGSACAGPGTMISNHMLWRSGKQETGQIVLAPNPVFISNEELISTFLLYKTFMSANYYHHFPVLSSRSDSMLCEWMMSVILQDFVQPLPNQSYTGAPSMRSCNPFPSILFSLKIKGIECTWVLDYSKAGKKMHQSSCGISLFWWSNGCH